MLYYCLFWIYYCIINIKHRVCTRPGCVRYSLTYLKRTSILVLNKIQVLATYHVLQVLITEGNYTFHTIIVECACINATIKSIYFIRYIIKSAHGFPLYNSSALCTRGKLKILLF